MSSAKKIILLTGATGFLGSHLLEALLKQYYNVVILKRSTSNTWRIQHLLDQVISYDVDIQPLELAFEQNQINAVIHTACEYGRNGESLYQIVDSNLMFSLKLLENSINNNIKFFLNTDTFFSRASNPNNFCAYTLCKQHLLKFLKYESKKIKIVNLELSHIFGPKDGDGKFVTWLINQLRNNADEIKLTKGEQLRDFTYVSDVVDAYLIILKKEKTLKNFVDIYIGTSNKTQVKEFVQVMKDQYINYVQDNRTKLAFGALCYREDEIMDINANNQDLINIGWKNKNTLTQGIQKTIGYAINHY